MDKCPDCNSENIKRYDKIKRLMIVKGGKKKWIDVPRYKCMDCNTIHRHLPKLLLPFKHYQVDIIYGVQKGFITSDTLGYEDYPCEETMKRWKKTK